jgi:hypothetical protein
MMGVLSREANHNGVSMTFRVLVLIVAIIAPLFSFIRGGWGYPSEEASEETFDTEKDLVHEDDIEDVGEAGPDV